MYLNLSAGNTPGLRTFYYLEVKDIKVVITWILQLIKNEMQASTQPKMSSSSWIPLYFEEDVTGDIHCSFCSFP